MNKTLPDKDWLSPQQAAERLGLSVHTIHSWRSNSRGPRYIKIGRDIYYPPEEVDLFAWHMLRHNTAEKKHLTLRRIR